MTIQQIISDPQYIPVIEVRERLLETYNKRKDFYHGFFHLEKIWEIFNTVKDELNLNDEEREIILYAIIYHDVEYKLGDTLNEFNSAKVFMDDFNKNTQLGKGTTVSTPKNIWNNIDSAIRVCECILATKNHIPKQNDDLVNLFLDIDLSMLGLSAEYFLEQDNRVYNEVRNHYGDFPRDDFNQKRHEVLCGLVKERGYYSTKIFKDLFQNNLKTNLKLK